ncbi:MAG: PH domain-containing protein [Planctomycetes bacterium]|nr:PH domain-containing protein [Planctomycetota bacterium]
MCPKCGNKVPVPLASPDEAPSELQLVVNSYIQHNLMPCEHLVGITCIHPLVLVAPGIVAALGLLLGLVGILVGESGILLVVIGLPMAVLAGLIMIAQLVERLTTEFSCTDRRIVIKSGLITTQLREMPLAKVEALLMEQGLFGKLFGYGTLVFKGTGGTRRTCKNIEAPFDFYKRVQQQVAVAQQHMPGGAGPRRTDG